MSEYHYSNSDDLILNTRPFREGMWSFYHWADLPSMGVHTRVQEKDTASIYLFMKKSDVYACIYNTEIFDFLIDIIPSE